MKKLGMLFLFLIALLVFSNNAEAACPNANAIHNGNECIVSANGTGSVCTEAQPCNFKFIVGGSTIATAGDHVWLRDDGGVYYGRFDISSALHGTVSNHIIVRNHCGLDGICDNDDDHHYKFDSYQTTTLTSNMRAPGDPLYNKDCTFDQNNQTSTVNHFTVADASVISTANPQDVIQINNTTTTAERVQIYTKVGNEITNCLREWDATVPTAHSIGDVVKVFGTNWNIDAYYVTFQGGEIYSSYPERAFPQGQAGDWTTKRGSCIFYNNPQAGSLVRIVDMVLHDCNHGLFTSSSSASLEMIDVLDFNQGFVNHDPNGLGWYTENSAPESKLFSNIIALNNYSSCGKIYSESLGQVQNFTVQKIICSNSGAPIAVMPSGRPAGYSTTTRTNGLQVGSGGNPSITGNVFTNNFVYMPLNTDAFYFTMWMGYQPPGQNTTFNNNAITNNYIVAPLAVNLGPLGTNLTFTGNTVIGALTGLGGSTTIMSVARYVGNTNWLVNNNSYTSRRTVQSAPPDVGLQYPFSYSTNSSNPLPAGCCRSADGGGGPGGASQLAFTSSNLVINQSSPSSGAANTPPGSGYREWSGFDAASTYGSTLPTVNVTGCLQRQSGPVGGHCYLYNWQGQASPLLSINNIGLANGDTYAVYDAFNWNGWGVANALVTGTFASANPFVTIPMSTLSATRMPIGTSNTIAHTAANGAVGGFGAFIVLKTSGGTGGGPPPPPPTSGRIRIKPAELL